MGREEAELRGTPLSIRFHLDADQEVHAAGGPGLVCDHRVVL